MSWAHTTCTFNHLERNSKGEGGTAASHHRRVIWKYKGRRRHHFKVSSFTPKMSRVAPLWMETMIKASLPTSFPAAPMLASTSWVRPLFFLARLLFAPIISNLKGRNGPKKLMPIKRNVLEKILSRRHHRCCHLFTQGLNEVKKTFYYELFSNLWIRKNIFSNSSSLNLCVFFFHTISLKLLSTQQVWVKSPPTLP